MVLEQKLGPSHCMKHDTQRDPGVQARTQIDTNAIFDMGNHTLFWTCSQICEIGLP
jgi:hypothetical protein